MAHHTTQKDINSRERAKLALSLRKQGMQLDEIATRCGYADKSGAYRAIKRCLDELPVDDAVELRKMELMRIDQLWAECWTLAFDPKNKGRLFAVDRLIELSRDRRKLLNLDVKPDEIAPNTVLIREVPQGYITTISQEPPE